METTEDNDNVSENTNVEKSKELEEQIIALTAEVKKLKDSKLNVYWYTSKTWVFYMESADKSNVTTRII